MLASRQVLSRIRHHSEAPLQASACKQKRLAPGCCALAYLVLGPDAGQLGVLLGHLAVHFTQPGGGSIRRVRPAAGGACGGPGPQLCQLLLLLPRVLLQLVVLSLQCTRLRQAQP